VCRVIFAAAIIIAHAARIRSTTVGIKRRDKFTHAGRQTHPPQQVINDGPRQCIHFAKAGAPLGCNSAARRGLKGESSKSQGYHPGPQRVAQEVGEVRLTRGGRRRGSFRDPTSTRWIVGN
jgi:hypothetical protein